jgi:hypothetical protein
VGLEARIDFAPLQEELVDATMDRGAAIR